MVPAVNTVIDCVVSPVDQRYPPANDAVNSTESPSQNVVEPLAVMVGVVGIGLTVTIVAAETAEHPKPFVSVTVYDPAVETVIDCVVSLVDQPFPLGDEDVNTTTPPSQNVVGPLAEISGAEGAGLTVILIVPAELEHPFKSVTTTE